MFRVYNTEKKKWIKDNIYLNLDGELFLIKHSIFGWVKRLIVLPTDKYICHKAIDLYDKNGTMVYEGDYIRAQVDNDRAVIGLVAYAHELSAYVILCVDTDEFYTLGSDVSEDIQVIGNVFDDYKK